ncbi:MAG: hypothetical protein UT61_C0048G0004 [Candidatus Woesebacteria bacterium GW2011_GWA1_39_8]|jgi:hypothetical protein|uniref:Uncharacterized protein n=1 Tax=Candidatus Woesebacteria bacterium GW2011_GWA1_39_8 TaxID=1618552 RepID=A0A0G0PTT3_9BACT|nr:MAG: hypothetical protein UT61_C0048G0004 [Candidatus Woesebacteria bacterium GW2011_GWA1_39_8]
MERFTFLQQPNNEFISPNEGDIETKCPFVSERGPSCELCGAPPTSVNLDPQGGYAHCDDCGGRFRIPRKFRR